MTLKFRSTFEIAKHKLQWRILTDVAEFQPPLFDRKIFHREIFWGHFEVCIPIVKICFGSMHPLFNISRSADEV